MASFAAWKMTDLHECMRKANNHVHTDRLNFHSYICIAHALLTVAVQNASSKIDTLVSVVQVTKE